MKEKPKVKCPECNMELRSWELKSHLAFKHNKKGD